MSAAGWAQIAATVFLGFVGLWLAHNYRRQLRLKLAERQVDAYLELWKLMAVASPERASPLDAVERRALYGQIMGWYIDAGNGLFVSAATRDLMVGVRTNLVCPVSQVQPPALGAELAALPVAEAERRRGCVSIRDVSLLRSQLKIDLALHHGFDHYARLGRDERHFLRGCGLSRWRRPWRRRLLRPSGAVGPIPCICGNCSVR
jgi:hypothetical protein